MKKLTEMTAKELQAEIDKNEDKRSELFQQMAPIEAKLVRLANRNKKLRDQVAKIKMKQKRIDWPWLLHTSHSESSMEKHYMRRDKLRNLNLRSGGFFPETEQVQIEIQLVKNDPKSLSKTLKGLEKILPYIKPLSLITSKEVNGKKSIGISERTLSEHGVYNLLIDDKGKCQLMKTTYHRPEIRKSFDNLTEALEYIQQYVYYEDAKATEEECDSMFHDDW